MEHLLLKATATTTDQGTFQAVISTATIDREKDIVDPQAMVNALQKWVPLGKNVPLRWNHGTEPEHIIGNIDPATAREVNAEVIVDGWVDQKSKRGAEAWRLVKSGTLGFSFGYMITEATARPGGGRHIKGMDVFEVTATHAPMNGDTRVVGWKSHVHDVCQACGQQIGQKMSDPEPQKTALSDVVGGTLTAPAVTGTPDVQKNDDGYWDDLRRESYRLAASVLIDE